jgi:hypothetical protein
VVLVYIYGHIIEVATLNNRAEMLIIENGTYYNNFSYEYAGTENWIESYQKKCA